MKYLYSEDLEYSGPDPFMYRQQAMFFLLCAEHAIVGCKVVTNGPPTMMHNVPLIHLICHAVEMLLKLGLYKTGSNERALKDRGVRHDLMELHTLCKRVGVVFSDEATKLIASLSPIHKDHRLRYTAFQNEPLWLPFDPSEMIAIARTLVGASHPSQSA